MDVEYYVSVFKLDSLEDEWVDAVWENEFITVDELSQDFYGNENIDQRIVDFRKELGAFTGGGSNDTSDTQKLWDSLGPQVKKLLPFIYYFIRQGIREDSDVECKTTSVKASGLYFVLLSIPGSSAYKVFRRLLFESALEPFKLSSLLRDESSAKGKRRNNEETFEDDTDNTLFYGQKLGLATALNDSLRDLLTLLKCFSLKDKADTFETTVQTIATLTVVDSRSTHINSADSEARNNYAPGSLDKALYCLTKNAYVALQTLAKGRLQDGNVPCVELVLDNILPALAWGGDGTARERTTIRNNMKVFVREIIFPSAKEEGHFDSTISTLVRHLCAAAVRMTIDIRRLVASTILELMSDMPCIDPVLDWIILFSRSERNNHRLMSMEVLGQMLLKSGTMKQLEDALPKIIEALAARFRDISPTVCGRALNALSECCSLPSALEVIKRLFDREVSQAQDPDESTPLTEGEVLITELFERMADIRAGVRRYALQVLTSLIPACPISYRKPILLLLRHHCLDPSSMVRKIALLSLTSLICMTLPEPEDSDDIKTCIEELEESWLRGVLPQICDRDIKVKEKALEYAWNVLILGKDGGNTPNANWHLIHRLEVLRLLPFLSEACSAWAKEKKNLGKDLWHCISSNLEGQHQYPAWVLMSTITEHSTIPDAPYIMNYYMGSAFVEDGTSFDEATNILVMRVLGKVSVDLSLENSKQLESHLLDRVSEFMIPPSLLRPSIDALYLISRHAYRGTLEDSDCHLFTPMWGASVIQSCEQYILSALNTRGGLSSRRLGAYGRSAHRHQPGEIPAKDQEEEMLIKRLLTMADVALVCPGVVKNSTIAAIQCILFPPPNARAGKRLRPPSPQLCSIAVVVLGKLCLQDARLAARIVPSLGSLLQRPPLTHPPPSDPAWASLRNNIMCALSDMCRSFAQLVDPLLPKMSACLHASDTTLRENALVLLVQLLQEDYLKVRRGALLFDLLTALNDPEISVSQLASYYLGRCLSHSQPSIMYQNILPALFHYNSYEGHEIYKVYTVDSSGRNIENVFHGSNEEEQMEERRNIFRFMLQHITDDQRQKIIGKICREVLGGVVEGAISLDCAEGCQLLADGLWMLTTEEIRPSGLKGNEDEMEEGEMAAEAALAEEAGASSETIAAAAEIPSETPGRKKKNQFPGMQKEMLDVLLPIAVSLMQRLESLQSPLLTHLMNFLVLTIKEYKIDVLELASGDQKLTDDLARNVKSFESKKN
ncbi:condensin-2 complex subunit D3-like [Ischnura elegans]|uniref:condensin-2 complex subunit D3-like n=1 Tax=Ischnura elegans TaxID=197161 RepID=UPI001ED88049|nr:condensin-2 complex subunit D3-like [Ischnura elegans]